MAKSKLTPEQRLERNRKRAREYSRRRRALYPEKAREERARSSKKWRDKNPDKRRDRLYRWNYGIGLEDVLVMLVSQGNVCAICKSDSWGGRHGRPNVDHDHSTGKVRAVLCHGCNAGLGSFRDNPELLLRAAAYLTQHLPNGTGNKSI